MRRTATHRKFVTHAVASAAIVVLPFGACAAAIANPPPVHAATTTVFQVPVTFVSGCSGVGFRCWVPHQLAVVTPSATTGEPGVVTFSAAPPAMAASFGALDCIDVAVNWRNLNTGAAGTSVLRAVRWDYKVDRSEPWCRYTPATVATGSGTVAATADVNASARIVPSGDSTWPQPPVNPGVGVFQVP